VELVVREMDEERKRKAEERKARILAKGASRMALVKGETVFLFFLILC
jgi:hypothetical protein